MYFALSKERAEIVKEFIGLILGSSLEEGAKKELLAAQGNSGFSGLSSAFQNGHTETGLAYLKAILADSALSLEAKQELLAAKEVDGNSMLHNALNSGKVEVVRAFAEAVLGSNLELADKQTLLAAKRENGDSGFYWAVKGGHAETAGLFAALILQDERWSLSEKKEFLAMSRVSPKPDNLEAIYAVAVMMRKYDEQNVVGSGGPLYTQEMRTQIREAADLHLSLIKTAEEITWKTIAWIGMAYQPSSWRLFHKLAHDKILAEGRVKGEQGVGTRF